MRKRRTLFFLTAILAGLLVSIGYGWWLRPSLYTQAELANLRVDYQTDYVLMTAEIFHQDNNLDEARGRLQLMGEENPARYAQEAIISAGQLGYGQSDLQLLANLLQAFEPPDASPTLAESPQP